LTVGRVPSRADGRVGAVDIGATKVLVGLANQAGQLLKNSVIRFETPQEPAALVEAIVIALAQVGGRDVRAIGCAVPGPLDASTGTLVRLHNRNWENVPLGPMLSDQAGVAVVLEDDATAAATGEALQGAGAGCDPVAYLTVSSGVGAGIVIGGLALRGAHGFAGEVGHLVIDPSGPLCGCGRRGDVESYAGGLCLLRRLEAHLPGLAGEDAEPALDTVISPASVETVFALARAGHPVASELIGEARYAVSFALAALAAVCDPERIVVGGSVALRQPGFLETAAEGARELVMAETGAFIDVRRASLGDNSALAGAAILGARLAPVPVTPTRG
jgi:glucokinase